jgi:S-adenosylmethionine/arginine decarboxylase-like enzyme
LLSITNKYIYTGGATLKKLETDNNVKIDIMRIRGLVRIRGTVKNCQAVDNIFMKFVDEAKITIVMDISELISTNGLSGIYIYVCVYVCIHCY